MDNLPPSRVTSPANPVALADALTAQLFKRLGAMYGKAWLDMWEGAPIDAVRATWASALVGCSPEMVDKAIDAMLERGQKFPPSLPEFVSLTRQFRRHAYPPRLAHAREPAPEGAFQSLRSLLAKAGDVPRETDKA